MCDYSLESFANRPAKVGDKLITTKFSGGGTTGFTEVGGSRQVAVCLRPGTEVVLENKPIRRSIFGWITSRTTESKSQTARFRKIEDFHPHTHHDALEFANGEVILLTALQEGQLATVIQLPVEDNATPKPTEKKVSIQETPELVD